LKDQKQAAKPNQKDSPDDPPAPMSSPLDRFLARRILLVVTGGIAAYKAAELARLITKSGGLVRVAMTEAATRFITPLTFTSLTGQAVVTDLWDRVNADDNVIHVAWSQWAEIMITCPATANFIAKLAHGLADDFASCTSLAFQGPRLVAPAMNTGMYLNPATKSNLEILTKRGYRVLESPEGLLACGTIGAGRMAEVPMIAWEAARLLSPSLLKGRRVVVTGGATREPWDDIRFLSNRSSGLMGSALASAAWLLGAEVTLIAGLSATVPNTLPEGLNVQRVETCDDLLTAVAQALDGAWALVMNAAPADFKPIERIKGKIRKSGQQAPALTLTRTPDILKTLSPQKGQTIMVGFAAEDGEDLKSKARDKLNAKNLDYIAANRAGGQGDVFESDSISLTLMSSGGSEIDVGPYPKFQAAWELWHLLASGYGKIS
jgi:phosphopantothenoylcysteine decarboxylase/phosphopantothenate--cysteine ligase